MRFEMNQAALIIQQNWRIQRQVRLQKALMRAKNAAMKAKVQHTVSPTPLLFGAAHRAHPHAISGGARSH